MAARAAFEELAERWGRKYGAFVRLWENAWEEFIPFLGLHSNQQRLTKPLKQNKRSFFQKLHFFHK